MFIKSIYLKNFRNYEELNIDFKNGINIIYGDNGQGKTNLLESIYVLGLTKSHRSFIDNNLIRRGSRESLIRANSIKDDIETTYEVNLKENKQLKIDGDIIKKVSDYISNINIIIFYPDDLEIIKGSPGLRRRYINTELSQLYSNYLVILNDYNKLLKMRNDYLKNVVYDNNYLDILTNYLIEKAVNIYIMRKKFIDKINLSINTIYENISTIKDFNVKYKTSINFEAFDSKSLKEKLKQAFDDSLSNDIRLKTTTIGPHKDDIEFYIGKYNLKSYGSQGQQRLAILTLKLAEIEIFKNYTKTQPILLLDDVFSELDDTKKNNLLNYINNDIQTIITTTDLNNINRSIIDTSKLIEISDGKIITR